MQQCKLSESTLGTCQSQNPCPLLRPPGGAMFARPSAALAVAGGVAGLCGSWTRRRGRRAA
eukprot:4775561-Prymnesium_polylepis.1